MSAVIVPLELISPLAVIEPEKWCVSVAELPNCVDADALATALIILGIDKAMQLIENTNYTEAFLIIRREKDVYETIRSSGMKIKEL